MENNDFNKLGEDVNAFVKQVMQSVEISDIKKNITSSLKDFENLVSVKDNKKVNLSNNITKVAKQNSFVSNELSPYVRSGMPWRTAGILQMVFGTIGSVAFGIAVIALLIVGVTVNVVVPIIVGLSLLPLFCISLIVALNGGTKLNSSKRFKHYITVLGSRKFCEIEEFGAIGKNRRFIYKDLQKMINRRWFFQARFDDQKKYFIVDNETYKQYLELRENGIRQSNISVKSDSKEQALSPELKQTIEEGKTYLIRMRAASNSLVETPMGLKLNRLENVAKNILDKVTQNPEKLSEIRRFMEYYLPTTMKLADAYKEFEKNSFEGETVSGAKTEILQTMDKIAVAFENLYDSLFDDLAMDVSTDISVLETMLAREGLANNDFTELK